MASSNIARVLGTPSYLWWSALAAAEMDGSTEGAESETRLAYVGVTRAKDVLVVCSQYDKHQFQFFDAEDR